MMGAADEAYYRCKVCGHEWLGGFMRDGLGFLKLSQTQQDGLSLPPQNQSRQHFPATIDPSA